MGGERETSIKAKPLKSGKLDKTIGDIRVHESKGEVHFHDDKNGRKVAVPVDRWFALWEKLRTDLGSKCFHDNDTGCMLMVSVESVADEIGVVLDINSVKQSSSFSNLDKFTNG